MDFSNVNWLWIGLPVIAIIFGVFVKAVAKRQWTISALVIGFAHLPLAMMHAAAPFRGSLDPNYVGYISGMVHAAKGFEVFVFASFMLIGATASAVIIVQNRAGLPNAFVLMFDSLVLLLFATPIIGHFLAGDFDDSRVEFGEYLQFGGTSAFLFEFLLIAVPFLAGAIWSWRKLQE